MGDAGGGGGSVFMHVHCLNNVWTTIFNGHHHRRTRRMHVVCGLLAVIVVIGSAPTTVRAQTEGDTGYDYNDAYEEEYEEESSIGMEPIFDVPIVNVTVVKGQTAVLPCSIDYLNKFKVAWLDYNSIPLTYEERRVVDDTRFSVVRPLVKEWNLQIRDIRWDDEGQYRCTINTNPVKSKLVMLHVKVPPEIIDELSSSDVTVQEGDTVTLTCNVTGLPVPSVTWERKSVSNKAPSVRDSKICEHRTTGPESGPIGVTLIIDKVTKQCDDVFECTASNGVSPNISRLIKLTVEFAPRISMPNLRIGQLRGRETILECTITAFPHASNYWEKEGRRITSTMKHRIEAYEEGDNTLTLSLRINMIDSTDFGQYKCVAANSLGRDEGVMELHEYTEQSIEMKPPVLLPDNEVVEGLKWSPAHHQTPSPALIHQNNNYHHLSTHRRPPAIEHGYTQAQKLPPGRMMHEAPKGRIFGRSSANNPRLTSATRLLLLLCITLPSRWV